MLEAIRAALPANTEIELWWQDEARVGQKNKITRRWAPRGTRPRAPRDQRTKSAYIFGAICPERGVGAALVLPRCNTQAMQWHLDEISSQVSNRIFKSYDEIVAMCCEAWNKLIDQPWKIISIGRRKWAHGF